MTATRPPRFARVAVGVAALTLSSRIVGFGRWLVFSKTVGDTCLGDAYNSANQLPNVLFEIAAGGVLASVVVPVISRQLADQREDQSARTASALICWTVLVLTPFAVAAMVFAHLYARTFVQTDCVGAAATAGSLLIIFAPQIWLYGLAVVSAGLLQAHRRFTAAAAAPLASSVVVIITYLIFASIADPAGREHPAALQRSALLLLGFGTTAGVLVLTLVTLVPLFGLRLRLRPTLIFPPGVPRLIISMASAGVVGLVMQQLSVMTGMFAANRSMISGAWTRATWAAAVYLLPYAVLIYPLHQLVFPRLGMAASQGRSAVERVLAGVAAPLVTLAGLGAGLLIAVAIPGARLLVLGPGSGDTMTLAIPIICYAPAVIGFALMGLATRTLYAEHRAAPAGITTAVAWAVVIVGILVARMLVPAAQMVAGIAAANSVGMLVGATIGWIMLIASRTGTVRLRMLRPLIVDTLLGLLLGALIGYLGRGLAAAGILGSIIGALVAATICLAAYAAGVFILDRPSWRAMWALRHPEAL